MGAHLQVDTVQQRLWVLNLWVLVCHLPPTLVDFSPTLSKCLFSLRYGGGFPSYTAYFSPTLWLSLLHWTFFSYAGRLLSYAGRLLSCAAYFPPTLWLSLPTLHISLLRCGFLSYIGHFSPMLADFSPTLHKYLLYWRTSHLW